MPPKSDSEAEMQMGAALPDKGDRILDTAAQVFAGYSECVAFAQIGDKYYVAANELADEFFVTNKKLKLAKNSIGLVRTFLHLGNDADKKEFRDKINAFIEYRNKNRQEIRSSTEETSLEQLVFNELVFFLNRPKRLLKAAGSLYTQEAHQYALDYAHSGNREIDLAAVKNLVGHNAEIGGMAIFGALSQKENFRKLRHYISDVNDNFLRDINEASEEESEIHAEMNILAKILELVDGDDTNCRLSGKIYIGISKACCFNCRHTLDAAKEVLLKERGIVLEYRGSHDISFAKNWKFPSIFVSSDDPLIVAIKKQAQEKFNINNSSTGVMQGHFRASSSEASSVYDVSFQLERNKQALEDLKEILLSLPVRGECSHNLALIDLGLRLFNATIYSDFLENFDCSADDAAVELVQFFIESTEYLELYSQQECESLLLFLQTPQYTGSSVAGGFRSVGDQLSAFINSKKAKEKAEELVLVANSSKAPKIT